MRSDLAALQSSGWLERQHGGAELAVGLVDEQPFDQRRGEHEPEKAELPGRLRLRCSPAIRSCSTAAPAPIGWRRNWPGAGT